MYVVEARSAKLCCCGITEGIESAGDIAVCCWLMVAFHHKAGMSTISRLGPAVSRSCCELSSVPVLLRRTRKKKNYDPAGRVDV